MTVVVAPLVPPPQVWLCSLKKPQVRRPVDCAHSAGSGIANVDLSLAATLLEPPGPEVDTPFGGCSTDANTSKFIQQYRIQYDGLWYVLDLTLSVSMTETLGMLTVATQYYGPFNVTR